jgi:hypothetical protein
MNEEISENVIAAPLRELITVFKENLSKVEFPDVSTAILENCAAAVEKNARELATIVAQENAARELLETSRNELLQKAIRAVAYAKVYAEDRPEIMARLSQINLGKASRAFRKATTEKSAPEEVTDAAAEKGEEKKHSRAARKTAEQKVEEAGQEG